MTIKNEWAISQRLTGEVRDPIEPDQGDGAPHGASGAAHSGFAFTQNAKGIVQPQGRESAS